LVPGKKIKLGETGLMKEGFGVAESVERPRRMVGFEKKKFF